MKNVFFFLLIVFSTAYRQVKPVTEQEHYHSFLKRFSFEKYKVREFYKGQVAKLDLSCYSNPKDVKQRIVASYSQYSKPNFAGNYILFDWGCGSPCYMHAIVDAKTGKTLKTFNSSFGVDFQSDSNLLIVNPPTDTKYDAAFRKTLGEPKAFLWKNNRLITLK